VEAIETTGDTFFPERKCAQVDENKGRMKKRAS
jgi:hypothetical protein